MCVIYCRQSAVDPRIGGTAVMTHCDLVIRNATIVDGTGAPRFQADLAVRNGLIERIGTLGKETAAARVIDASGKILAPRFSAKYK